jgi:hypothetical protein
LLRAFLASWLVVIISISWVADQSLTELDRDPAGDTGAQLNLTGVEQKSCANCHHAAFQVADGQNIARGVCTMSPDLSELICDETILPASMAPAKIY